MATGLANVARTSNRLAPGAVAPAFSGLDVAHAPRAPLVLAILAALMFLPEEASFSLGEMRMSPTRLVLVVLAPIVVAAFWRLASSRRYRFVWSDVFVALTAMWMFVGPVANEGVDRVLLYCGSSALEFSIPYFAARVLLSGDGEAAALVKIFCIAIAVVGFLAVIDEAGGRFLLRETIAALPIFSRKGVEDMSLFAVEDPDLIRGPLFRAASTFDHPILLGTACVFGLLLSTTLSGRVKTFCLTGSGVGLFLSVSSAPMVAGVLGFGVLLYEKMSRGLPRRWTLLAIFGVVPLLAILLLHPDPLAFILDHMTLQAHTAWYRVLQWQCAGGQVLESPLLGIGVNSNWSEACGLAATVDSFWLLNAMMFGIPGAVLAFLCYVSPNWSPRGDLRSLSQQEQKLALVLTLVLALAIWIGFTVHFWGQVYVSTLFLAGIRAHLAARSAV